MSHWIVKKYLKILDHKSKPKDNTLTFLRNNDAYLFNTMGLIFSFNVGLYNNKRYL